MRTLMLFEEFNPEDNKLVWDKQNIKVALTSLERSDVRFKNIVINDDLSGSCDNGAYGTLLFSVDKKTTELILKFNTQRDCDNAISSFKAEEGQFEFEEKTSNKIAIKFS